MQAGHNAKHSHKQRNGWLDGGTYTHARHTCVSLVVLSVEQTRLDEAWPGRSGRAGQDTAQPSLVGTYVGCASRGWLVMCTYSRILLHIYLRRTYIMHRVALFLLFIYTHPRAYLLTAFPLVASSPCELVEITRSVGNL